MTAAQRRASLYVLLLLGPALVIGGGALWLLQREQARLLAEAQAARDARQEALGARVRLIAENVGVLLADMQTSINDILTSAPRRASEAYLRELQSSNPFVKSVFIADAGGRILWGDPAAGDLDATPLMPGAVASAKGDSRGRAVDADERPASGGFSASAGAEQAVANVAQYQAARSDFRAEVQLKTAEESLRQRAAKVATAPAAASVVERAPLPPAAAASSESIEWIPRTRADGPHLWARRRLADGLSIGVGVNLAQLRSRLEDVFPTAVERDEVYRLLAPDENWPTADRYLSSAPRAEKNGRDARVVTPLSAALLPGWRVVGVRPDEETGLAGGSGFMVAAGLLIIVLMVAIGVGGALLWREARRQELEAVRRTTFVANVSHEFKTPLTTIRLFAELLGQGRVAAASQQSEYLGAIGEEAARLTRLVENVLSLGRIEAGKHRLQKTGCESPGEFVVGLMARQRPTFEAAGVALTLVVEGEPGPVEWDRDAVRQILTNLLDNALKYGGAGGAVDVAVRPAGGGGSLEIEVADRGPGIPGRDAERMFESFRRGDERLTAEQGGAGLGLGIARSLARAHGGDLRYEARAGGGARFIVFLP